MSNAAMGFALAAACVVCGPANAQHQAIDAGFLSTSDFDKPVPATAGRTATTNEAQGPTVNKINPKRHGPTLTPKTPKTTPAVATGSAYSKQPKSSSKAPVSCTEACRAACSGPKKSKSACGPGYDSCVAAC